MAEMTSIRVMIADDQAELRSALADLVRGEDGLELVGSAANATEAIEVAGRHRPDVALIDVRMPEGGGVRAATEIRDRSPHTRVIALSAYEDRATVRDMLRVGAIGYLVKGTNPGEIVEAIVRASRGRGVISGHLVPDLVDDLGARLRREADDETVIATIRACLEMGGPSIVVQPIVELADGSTVGFEALARFPEGGWNTQEWFQRAAQVGLTDELEIVAVRSALALLPRIGPECYLSLNVSHRTAQSEELERLIAASDAARIVVEITEHEPVEDYARLSSHLAELRHYGVRVAIDDAGAGFASLRHILALSPDIIKMDIGITAGIDSDRARRAIAKAFVTFGGEIGISLLAEGIETRAELDTLLELGVTLGQGYLLARPAQLP